MRLQTMQTTACYQHMKIYTQIYKQNIPIDIHTAWDFFSSPNNLSKITPEKMNFIVTSHYNAEKMYPGMLITYKVSPVFGIQLDWCTEITHVEEGKYFVDEQRFGMEPEPDLAGIDCKHFDDLGTR